MNQALQYTLLANPRAMVRHIQTRLRCHGVAANWLGRSNDGSKGSAVLFLLTQNQAGRFTESESCLLLNKRSQQVLQPGDLCCPGGGVTALDKFMSPLMRLPYSPLDRWPPWPQWRVRHREMTHRLALVMTTAMREAWEEMRLNPLKVSFLGPLPAQQLVLFERRIFPLAAWVQIHKCLKPNWEVERIVHVPLRRLLDSGNYGRYRLTFDSGQEQIKRIADFPCFIHKRRQGIEILWGATFRIAMDFLKLVFDFSLPDLESLPVVWGRRDKTYLNGSSWEMQGLVKEEGEHNY